MTGAQTARAKTAPTKGRISAARRKKFRADLEAKRSELLSFYRHDLAVGQTPSDEGTEDLVDLANKAYNQELMFQLSDTERTMVFAVEEAIERLETSIFGICLHCSEEIGLPRLNAVPWARYCIGCQERDEKGMLD